MIYEKNKIKKGTYGYLSYTFPHAGTWMSHISSHVFRPTWGHVTGYAPALHGLVGNCAPIVPTLTLTLHSLCVTYICTFAGAAQSPAEKSDVPYIAVFVQNCQYWPYGWAGMAYLRQYQSKEQTHMPRWVLWFIFNLRIKKLDQSFT